MQEYLQDIVNFDEISEETIDEIFDQMDTDKSTIVNKTEFGEYLGKLHDIEYTY